MGAKRFPVCPACCAERLWVRVICAAEVTGWDEADDPIWSPENLSVCWEDFAMAVPMLTCAECGFSFYTPEFMTKEELRENRKPVPVEELINRPSGGLASTQNVESFLDDLDAATGMFTESSVSKSTRLRNLRGELDKLFGEAGRGIDPVRHIAHEDENTWGDDF